MPVLGLELPHVFVGVPHAVVAHLVQDLLQIGERLPRLAYQVLDVVVLVLLEQGKKHVHDLLPIGPTLLALLLLLQVVSDVGRMVGHRLVRVDHPVHLLGLAGRLHGQQQSLLLQTHVDAARDGTALGPLHHFPFQRQPVLRLFPIRR